jgi:hypothetical protein
MGLSLEGLSAVMLLYARNYLRHRLYFCAYCRYSRAAVVRRPCINCWSQLFLCFDGQKGRPIPYVIYCYDRMSRPTFVKAERRRVRSKETVLN